MTPINNNFEKWIPTEQLGFAYDVENISWGADGLSFALICEDKTITPDKLKKFSLVWDSGSVVSYHVTDETYRADCWDLDFENDGRFYISRESEYISNLKQKSRLFPENILHFVIVGTNTIVDVLAKTYPEIK